MATVLPFRRPNARKRKSNAAYRSREHLTEQEVEQLIAAARTRGRYGHRDATAIEVCFTHGLRAAELCGLRWDDVDLKGGTLNVRRRKGGVSGTHPLTGSEIRNLRRLRREVEGPHVFVTERGGPMTSANFRYLVKAVGEAAGFPWPVHPHQLRHAAGYKLANANVATRTIAAYLGHASLSSTARYTAISPRAFAGLFDK